MGSLGTFLKSEGPLLAYDLAIHRTLRRDYKEADAGRKHEIHASLLDGDTFCLRNGVLAAAGELDRYAPLIQLLRFEDGNWRHKKWQHLLDRAKVSAPLLSEQRQTLLVMTHATPDKIIYLNRLPYVWECKGMRDDLFRAVVKRGKPPLQFVRRMHLYFAATKIPRGILHIDAKGSNEYRAFVVKEDRTIMNEVLERAQRLEQAYQKYIKRKILPPRCTNHACETCRD